MTGKEAYETFTAATGGTMHKLAWDELPKLAQDGWDAVCRMAAAGPEPGLKSSGDTIPRLRSRIEELGLLVDDQDSKISELESENEHMKSSIKEFQAADERFKEWINRLEARNAKLENLLAAVCVAATAAQETKA